MARPNDVQDRGVVTVIGKDRVGIIAGVAKVLADQNVNIADITQTVMRDLFTMNMIVDFSKMRCSFHELSKLLEEEAKKLGVKIYIHKEEVFRFMHTI
ncbi:MAG: ACT domain-containing protein [Firmicutes bacterium]|nr:ACT domain-containing protein [Bacillota bacterium]